MAIDCKDPMLDDPLYPMFEEWVRRLEVQPHFVHEIQRKWQAFRAGADAEHQRILQCFKDAGVGVDVDKIEEASKCHCPDSTPARS